MHKFLLDTLSIGDMRTTDNVDEVVREVLADPRLLDPLLAAIEHENPGVRMRAADALEKITRSHQELVQVHKKRLLSILEESTQQEVQWHLAQILPRLILSRDEQTDVYALLSRNFHESDSAIVKTWSLQAMADFTSHLPDKRDEVKRVADEAVKSGTPALKSRARKILERLE